MRDIWCEKFIKLRDCCHFSADTTAMIWYALIFMNKKASVSR